MRQTMLLLAVVVLLISSIPSVGIYAAAAESADKSATKNREVPGLIKLSDYVPLRMIDAEEAGVYLPAPGGADMSYSRAGCAEYPTTHCYQLGTTWYEQQHNGTMGRQVAYDRSQYRVHFMWTYQDDTYPTGQRWAVYMSLLNGTLSTMYKVSTDGNRGGYVNIDNWNEWAVQAYHEAEVTDQSYVRFQMGFAPGGGLGTVYPQPNINCQGHQSGNTEGIYVWPKIAVQVGPSGQTPAMDTIVHLVSCELTPQAGDVQTFVYYRLTGGFPLVTDGTPSPCGYWYKDSWNLMPVVRSEKDGARVAIVYPASVGGDSQLDNDIAYIMNDNYGDYDDWGAEVNITNYTAEDLERAYTDLSAMFTSDGCLHIIWSAQYYNQAEGIFHHQWANLYHWAGECPAGVPSSHGDGTISLVHSAYNDQNCLPGAWNRNISKMNISECIGFIDEEAGIDTLIYCTYTYFKGDIDGEEDCSVTDYANGEICAQASSTYGKTWGPPTNLTNTPSPECTAGNCLSEHWSSSAMYTYDSLRIQFIQDLDAGSGVKVEGTWTENPVLYFEIPCFAMEECCTLSAVPNEFCYPFGGEPGNQYCKELLLINNGTVTCYYTTNCGSGFIALNDTPPFGEIEPGIENAKVITICVNAPVIEGLYTGTCTFDYDDGSGPAQLVIDIEFYSFEDFYAPEDAAIRTITNRLNVANLGRVGHQSPGNQMSYFRGDDPAIDYLFDGSLVIGSGSKPAAWTSWMIFDDDDYCEPWIENVHGRLWPLSGIFHDSTSMVGEMSLMVYRFAQGMGCNDDSTIAFRCQYFAPGYPDSSDFYIARFDVFSGPKYSEPIEDVFLAFAVDFDVPSDTGADNISGVNDTLQLVWQQGQYPASPDLNDQRFAGIAFLSHDSADAEAGWSWDNDTWVYPHNDYPVDDFYTEVTTRTGWTAFSDSTTDLNSVIVAQRGVEVNDSSIASFSIALVGYDPPDKTLADLEQSVVKARKFHCEHVFPAGKYCQCLVGDADGNGIVEISDAVYLVQYVFTPGSPRPVPDIFGSGDPDCSGVVEISDAIYMVQYIFVPGSPLPGDPDDDGIPDCKCWPGPDAFDNGYPQDSLAFLPVVVPDYTTGTKLVDVKARAWGICPVPLGTKRMSIHMQGVAVGGETRGPWDCPNNLRKVKVMGNWVGVPDDFTLLADHRCCTWYDVIWRWFKQFFGQYISEAFSD